VNASEGTNVRVCAETTDGRRYLIDVAVDAAGRNGSVQQGPMYPFVLLADGRLDYGTQFDDSERFQQSNLRDRLMRVDELATITVDILPGLKAGDSYGAQWRH